MPNYDYQLKIGADEKVLLQSLEKTLQAFESGHPAVRLTADTRKLESEVKEAVSGVLSQLKNSAVDLDALLKTDRFVQNLNQATKALKEYQKELAKTAGAGTIKTPAVSAPAVKAPISAPQSAAAEIAKTKTAYEEFLQTVQTVQKTVSNLNHLPDSRLFQYLPSLGLISQIIEALRNGVSTAESLHQNFMLLEQSSRNGAASLAAFRQESFQIAAQIGSTSSAVASAANSWTNLGYSIQDSAELAKAALVFSNLNVGMDQASAALNLSSVLSTFQMNADKAMSVVDKLSALRGGYSATTTDLLNIVQNSSLALSVSGDSIDQLLSMGTALNQTMQNAASAGNVLQTVSLRLHDMRMELESTGAGTAGMAEHTAQLREEIRSLTNLGGGGFDILSDSGSLKSTYDILQGIAAVWNQLSSGNQSSILGRIAGEGNAQPLGDLLSNWSRVDALMQVSQNSAGAAIQENEKYLNSYQGHLVELQNSLEKLWSISFDPGFLTFFIDAAKGAADFASSVGGLNTVLPALIGILLQIKGASK